MLNNAGCSQDRLDGIREITIFSFLRIFSKVTKERVRARQHIADYDHCMLLSGPSDGYPIVHVFGEDALGHSLHA